MQKRCRMSMAPNIFDLFLFFLFFSFSVSLTTILTQSVSKTLSNSHIHTHRTFPHFVFSPFLSVCTNLNVKIKRKLVQLYSQFSVGWRERRTSKEIRVFHIHMFLVIIYKSNRSEYCFDFYWSNKKVLYINCEA